MTILPQLLLFAGIAGAMFWFIAQQARKARANVQGIAERLGLVLTEKKSLGMTTGFELNGPVAGRDLRFWTYTTGSGKNSTTWCAVSVSVRATGRLAFELRRQGFTTKVMALFGAKEISVGDAAFDAAWFVQTNEPDFLRAALGPEIRAKLMPARADGATGSFKLEAGAVRYAEQGSFSDARQSDRLEQKVPLLQDLADLAEVFAEQKA